MSINVVNLVGRVGTDPDVRYFESGAIKCKLTLAVNRQTRNSDQPDWFNLEIWGKTAQVAANYAHKGKLIGVQGSLKIERWSDRATGAERSSPIILVNRLELLGSRRDNEPSAVDSYSDGDVEF